MELLVAACGLLCNKCPAYEATMNKDQALAEATAQQWCKEFNADVRVEHVWCTGCMSPGEPKSAFCGQMCKIRRCVKEKQYDTCASCQEYESCAKLAFITEKVPPAKALLNSLCAYRTMFCKS